MNRFVKEELFTPYAVLLTYDGMMFVSVMPRHVLQYSSGRLVMQPLVFDISETEKDSKKYLERILDVLSPDIDFTRQIRDLEKIIWRIIDRERRVKEGGLLIAAYIKYYLERDIKPLVEVLPYGWGRLTLQLMAMYFFHRLGEEHNVKEMQFDLFREYQKIKEIYEKEGMEGVHKKLEELDEHFLWNLLRQDLEKFERISKNVIFGVKEWTLLTNNGIILQNDIFIGDLNVAEKLRWENLKIFVKKIKQVLEAETKRKSPGNVLNEVVYELRRLGLLPLFELRTWYEGGLIGDIIGGVYEGIKKIEERKKGGIYYTPRFIVEYIVDNTLGRYLKEMLERVVNRSVDDPIEFLRAGEMSADQLEQFYEKLLSVKLLDPACGTGHFLVYAMEVFENYYAALLDHTLHDSAINGRLRITILRKDTNGKITEEDIALKNLQPTVLPFAVRQHLILRNNIYGVDIDEEAHLIAKTRLLIESFKYFNRDVWDSALVFPDLEINIKLGNSLVGFVSWNEIEQVLKKGKQVTLFDFSENRKPTTLKRLLELMGQVKRGKNAEAYEQIMSQIRDELDSAYLDFLREKGVKISLEELKELKPFHWIAEFPDAFFEFSSGSVRPCKNAGFDIIIGNPPYGKTEKIFSQKEKLIVTATYENLFEKPSTGLTTDISVLFLYRGIVLLRKDGTLSYILTNKWMRSDYGENIRGYLKHYEITKIVDFGHKMVFKDATAYTAIIIVRKRSRPENGTFKFIPPRFTDPENEIVIKEGLTPVELPLSILTNEKWVLEDPQTLEILNYVKHTGQMLKDLNPNIFAGVKTGYNEAFVIDTETRNRLVKEDPKSAKLIKPLLRGRDIEPYRINWDGKWLIYIPWHFPLPLDSTSSASSEAERAFKARYPAIYSHLLRYKEPLSRRNKKETGIRYEWYALQRFAADYYQEFEKPKIVWRDISKYPMFVFDPGIFYLLNTMFLARGLQKGYLVILNSRVGHALFRRISPRLRGGFIRYIPTQIEKYLLPKIGERQLKLLGILTDYLQYLAYRENLTAHFSDLLHLSEKVAYELYFKDKFYEDGLYPEPKYYLLEAISRHLKPINYDEWAKLYWRKKIYDDLSEGEERRLNELEKQNLKTVQEVVEALKSDPEVQKWVEKIMSHPWVKTIEEEISGGKEDEQN